MILLSIQNLLMKFVCHSDNIVHPLEMALDKCGFIARSVVSAINFVVEDVVLLCYSNTVCTVCGTPPVPVCRLSPIKKG